MLYQCLTLFTCSLSWTWSSSCRRLLLLPHLLWAPPFPPRPPSLHYPRQLRESLPVRPVCLYVRMCVVNVCVCISQVPPRLSSSKWSRTLPTSSSPATAPGRTSPPFTSPWTTSGVCSPALLCVCVCPFVRVCVHVRLRAGIAQARRLGCRTCPETFSRLTTPRKSASPSASPLLAPSLLPTPLLLPPLGVMCGSPRIVRPVPCSGSQATQPSPMR